MAERDGRVVPAASTVLQDGAFLKRPGRLAALGSRLVVLDEGGEMHVLRGDGARVATIRGEGQGPGGLRAPAAVDPDPRDRNSFWIYDLQQVRATRFTFVDAGRSSVRASDSVQFARDEPVTQPLWLNDSTLIGSGLFKDARFRVFDARGAKLRGTGGLPPAGADRSVPAEVRQHAYTGRLTLSARRGRFAMATRHADELSFYDTSGRLLRRVRGSGGYEPAYQVRRLKGVPFMTTGDELRFGYIDIASTDDLVYALFSGRTRAKAPGRANYGEYVQVFDWNGTLLRTFRLDAPAIAIAVDPSSGESLLALRHHPSPALLRFRTGDPRQPQDNRTAVR